MEAACELAARRFFGMIARRPPPVEPQPLTMYIQVKTPMAAAVLRETSPK